MPCIISHILRSPGDILEFGADICTVLSDILLHKLKMAGGLSSLEEGLRYGYFWNQGIKLNHIGGCHFGLGSDTYKGAGLLLGWTRWAMTWLMARSFGGCRVTHLVPRLFELVGSFLPHSAFQSFKVSRR